MNLFNECTREWLDKCIPVLLIFGSVVLKAQKNDFIEFLRLAPHLWKIPGCCKVFSTVNVTNRSEEFDDKLRIIVSKYVRRGYR